MRSARFFFVGLLFTVGCASIRDIRAVRGEDNLYRPQFKKADVDQPIEPERVLRTSDGRVVTDANEADQILAAAPDLSHLRKSTRAGTCSIDTVYRAKVAQFAAERALMDRRYLQALHALDEGERICPDLHLISAQDWLRAVALHGLGRTEEAREAARRFLHFASAIQPGLYVQSDGPSLNDIRRSWAEDHKLLHKYRLRASSYLESGTEPVWDEPAEIAKFRPNQFLRPGGNRLAGGFVAPAFYMVEPSVFVAALAGFYSWGRTSVQGLYGYSTESGHWVNGRVRRSIYESPNRDLNVDVFAGARMSKLLRITTKSGWYDSDDDVKVVRTVLDPAVGGGTTYRVRPEVGVSGQLAGISSQLRDRVDTQYSLYGFYEPFPDFSLNAGYLDSNPMIFLNILWVQLGYDFRNEGIRAVLQNFSF